MNILFRVAILLVPLALWSCSKTSSPVTITDYGTYDAVVVTKGDWKLKPPVTIASVEGLEHKETTTSISARDGVYWGYRAHIVNPNADKPVEVTMVITHPPITTPDGKTSTEERNTASLGPQASVDAPMMWFFIDSCPHEFVPGEWTLQILVDGKVEASKSFEVYKP